MQVTHLSEAECSTATSSVQTLVKHKAKLSRSTPDAILYLSQALGLINLFSYQQQSHFTNLFLLANSSFLFMKNLFLYRLRFIQYYFLIPISPLLVLDWTCWSALTIFKQDYIASTIALLVSTPFHLLRANLSSVPDLTYPNGHTPLYQYLSLDVFKSNLGHLRKHELYYLSQLLTPQRTHLTSWSVIYSNSTQKQGNTRVLKWYINLSFNVTDPHQPGLLRDRFFSNQPTMNSITKELVPCTGLPLFDKQLQVQPMHSTCTIAHWISDCSSCPAADIAASSSVIPSLDSHYTFYTDGSLINLGTNEVSMGWAAAIYAALSASPVDSVVKIYTDSQTAIDDLAAAHDFILVYDDVVCESNPRHLFKHYHQMLFMKDLLNLSRFHFLSLLSGSSSYIVDWALTWHTLLFQPKHDDSFTMANASLHYAMKFQLFLEDLPTLEALKRL
ncbi:unnamed protein product [Rhizophagus irregularis]|nr:unnamed protein product [Rhizophagus irregularis]